VTDPATTPTAAEPAEAPQPGVRWLLDIDAPDELSELLGNHLDLARFQKAEGEAAITRSELERLVAAAPQQVRELLETEGWFSPRVSVRLADGGARNRQGQLRVRVEVQAGERTRVRSARLVHEGALSVAAEGGDATARALVQRAEGLFSAQQRQPFTQAGWSATKASVLGLLRAEGYPNAAWSGTTARIDAPAALAELFGVVDSGPLHRVGSLTVEGLSHVRESVIQRLQPFQPGEVLREQILVDFQEKLVKTGLFDSVSVTVEPDSRTPESVPVTVRVQERALQQATLGTGVSDLTGPRVTLEHLHQRPFDWAWVAKTKIEYGTTKQTLSLDMISHPQPGLYRNLFSTAITRTESAGLQVLNQRARLGRTQDTDRIERLYYFEWQRASTRPLAGNAGTPDEARSLSFNYQWVWRDLDHPLLPTRGISSTAEAGGGYSFHSTADSGWFGRGMARVTTYWTPGEAWYATTRLQLGEVFAGPTTSVPYTLLFRAGGEDSVRGYAYESLGPSKDGGAVGGRVLGTASFELARPFSLRMPAFWGAVFVDAGNAAASWRELKPAIGYGFGVRWRSPVGPLKLDLAWGDQTRAWRMHFSVGIVF
jgi:translocation and assembly module TamA